MSMALADTLMWITDTRQPIGTPDAEAELTKAAKALRDSLWGEPLWNDKAHQLTHIVVNVDDFGMYGDAATVCGEVARSATSDGPEYDICPDCTA